MVVILPSLLRLLNIYNKLLINFINNRYLSTNFKTIKFIIDRPKVSVIKLKHTL